MSSISNSTYFSVGASNGQNNGLSGLMSGMDTESMVKKMLMGTQSKIDKQEALKLQTKWKQDVYRNMTSTINTFKNKYFNQKFDASSKLNFASNNFFNSMISNVVSGSAAKIVSTNSSALTGDFKLKVKQLAENAKLQSATSVSIGSNIEGKILTTEELGKSFEESITLDVLTNSTVTGTDGKVETKTDTKKVKIALNQVKTEDELINTLQNALNNSGFSGKLEVSTFQGKLRLTSKDENISFKVNNESSSIGLSMTGLGSMSLTNVTGGKMYEADTKVALDASNSINVSLDGVTKTIKLPNVNGTYDASGKYIVTHDDIVNNLNEELKKAFGDSITASTTDGKIKLNLTGNSQGHEMSVTGIDSLKLGIDAGTSNHINLSSKLSSLPGVSGDKFSFSINGTDFSFNGDTTIANMINSINNSSAGVKMTYSTLEDKFNIETASSGANYGIDIIQKEGNALSIMFGEGNVASGSSASSSYLTTDTISGSPIDADFKTNSLSLTMVVNGKEYTFKMNKEKDAADFTKSDIETSLNSWLKTNFKDTISFNEGKFTIQEGNMVEFKKTSIDPTDTTKVNEAKKHDLGYILGLTVEGSSNIANENTDISSIFELKGTGLTGRIGDLTNIDGQAVKFADGRLTVTGDRDITFTNATLKNLFGDTVKLGSGQGATISGKDAIVVLNGVETSRNSNTFTVEGLTLQLTELSKEVNGKPGELEETVISTKRDNDQIIDGFKSFVKDYNDMIKKLNDYVKEDDDYKEYPPLTAEQKKEMSETEIKLWEEKSKKGLVRNDSIALQFMSEMRNVLYKKPSDNALALYQIGIETTKDYNDGGQIQLDEEALVNALNQSPDQVRNLFMDAKEGLADSMIKIMDDVASERLSKPGLLVQAAGVKGGSTEKINTMYDRINNINSRIKDLKGKYEKEKARYWKQFNSMETILANFNSQSAMISNQFGK